MATVECSGIDCGRSVRLRLDSYNTVDPKKHNNLNVTLANGDLTMTSTRSTVQSSIVNTPRRRSDAGIFVLVFAACVAVLLGFLGLAFDASYMYFYKRRMQTAAEAVRLHMAML